MRQPGMRVGRAHSDYPGHGVDVDELLRQAVWTAVGPETESPADRSYEALLADLHDVRAALGELQDIAVSDGDLVDEPDLEGPAITAASAQIEREQAEQEAEHPEGPSVILWEKDAGTGSAQDVPRAVDTEDWHEEADDSDDVDTGLLMDDLLGEQEARHVVMLDPRDGEVLLGARHTREQQYDTLQEELEAAWQAQEDAHVLSTVQDEGEEDPVSAEEDLASHRADAAEGAELRADLAVLMREAVLKNLLASVNTIPDSDSDEPTDHAAVTAMVTTTTTTTTTTSNAAGNSVQPCTHDAAGVLDEDGAVVTSTTLLVSSGGMHTAVVTTTTDGPVHTTWLVHPLSVLLHVVDVVVGSTQPVLSHLAQRVAAPWGEPPAWWGEDPEEGQEDDLGAQDAEVEPWAGYDYPGEELEYTANLSSELEEPVPEEDEEDDEEPGADSEADSGATEPAVLGTSLPWRGAGQAVAGTWCGEGRGSVRSWWSVSVVPPGGRVRADGGVGGQGATSSSVAEDADSSSGAVMLAGLLLATAAMLVGFVRTFLQLQRSMRGVGSHELLVPFIIEHQGELRQGYMVVDQSHLAAAVVQGVGASGASMKVAGALPLPPTPKQGHGGDKEGAQAAWAQQQAALQQDLLRRLAAAQPAGDGEEQRDTGVSQ